MKSPPQGPSGPARSPQDPDVRTALPAGTLLTAIFLQKSYSDGHPDLAYLILMDKIYLVAYSVIVQTLIRAIFTLKSVPDAEADVIRRGRATDQKPLIPLVLVSVAAVIAVLLLR